MFMIASCFPLFRPPPIVCLCMLQVLTDLASLYMVAITVGMAAFVGFRCFSFMLEKTHVYPGNGEALTTKPVLFIAKSVEFL